MGSWTRRLKLAHQYLQKGVIWLYGTMTPHRSRDSAFSFALSKHVEKSCLASTRRTHESPYHARLDIALHIVKQDAVTIGCFDNICQILPGEDALVIIEVLDLAFA